MSAINHIVLHYLIDGQIYTQQSWNDVTPANNAHRYRHYVKQVRKAFRCSTAEARHQIMHTAICHAVHQECDEFWHAAFLNLMLHDHPPLFNVDAVQVIVDGDAKLFTMTFVGVNHKNQTAA